MKYTHGGHMMQFAKQPEHWSVRRRPNTSSLMRQNVMHHWSGIGRSPCGAPACIRWAPVFCSSPEIES